jgi:hypothetical protein
LLLGALLLFLSILILIFSLVFVLLGVFGPLPLFAFWHLSCLLWCVPTFLALYDFFALVSCFSHTIDFLLRTIDILARMCLYNGRSTDCKPFFTTSLTIFHPSKFSLVLVLIVYHLYGMDLQNKIL